ncbi:NAD(P)H-dependent amine dehydrogenase family protein [Fodinibius halophilus]|uniref:Dihydrodipicolinate reductase n=1 Tax=Fodinibius halophilus TaxID=1736908 RepID=A0A6M1T2W4_9BACT|nr:dihydrodipicolinate reductase [Fodinibius halophilus]NGP89806.1 dihydrodipicolinate reductase [Fodinibius halophilus]
MMNIVQMGLGPIGQQLTRYLAEREGISIVGGIDPDPNKIGNDLGEHAGLQKIGVEIAPDLDSVALLDKADVAVITTLSSLKKVSPQIIEAAGHGLDIVSTCEELSHPWQTQPEVAKRIDEHCRKQAVSCLGTGVNPGFLMDYLPSVLTSVCQKIDKVKVERIQDAEPRRKPFRDKIGIGLTEAEFKAKRDSIRHVGVEESVRMIADAMNWQLSDVEETLELVKADRDLKNDRIDVDKGQVSGVKQVGRGYRDGKEVITLVFKAAAGVTHSHDTINISGTPTFTSTIDGGINGDIATSAITVNAICSVREAGAGLKTMLDIQVPAYFDEASP